MKMCPSCKIKIEGALEQCPLCQNELQGESSEAVFPSGELLKKQSFVYKLQMFIFLAAMVISLMLDFKLKFHGSLHWSLFVAVWVIGGELCARGLIRNHSNPTRIITYTAIWLAILVTPTLLVLGLKNILVLYVLPGLQILVMILNFIYTMIDKAHNALVYLLSIAAVGLISSAVVILFLDLEDTIWVACATVSIILLMAISIFRGKRTKSEIRKRLNF